MSIPQGKIIAANIADDGGIAGSAGVFATALKDNNDRHVTIEEPGNRCTITNPTSFTVEGSAQGGVREQHCGPGTGCERQCPGGSDHNFLWFGRRNRKLVGSAQC